MNTHQVAFLGGLVFQLAALAVSVNLFGTPYGLKPYCECVVRPQVLFIEKKLVQRRMSVLIRWCIWFGAPFVIVFTQIEKIFGTTPIPDPTLFRGWA